MALSQWTDKDWRWVQEEEPESSDREGATRFTSLPVRYVKSSSPQSKSKQREIPSVAAMQPSFAGWLSRRTGSHFSPLWTTSHLNVLSTKGRSGLRVDNDDGDDEILTSPTCYTVLYTPVLYTPLIHGRQPADQQRPEPWHMQLNCCVTACFFDYNLLLTTLGERHSPRSTSMS